MAEDKVNDFAQRDGKKKERREQMERREKRQTETGSEKIGAT